MKKIFILSSFLLVFLMTGCLSLEQKQEKTNIEKEVKQIMKDYLKDNYNISEVYNVEAQYTLTGDIADSQFKKIVTANFKKEGIAYQILYNYNEEKCYDSFSYIEKVNPILTDYVKSILDNSSTYDINKPNYIVLNDMYYRYTDYYKSTDIDNNYSNYGFFNNYDEVNTYDEIISYFKNTTSINIIYNTSNDVIDNNISAFKELANVVHNEIVVDVYNQGVIKEHFDYNVDNKQYIYYNNEIKKVGDFIVYWKVKEEKSNTIGKTEQGDFKISLVNNYYFEKKIKLYGNEYYLYSDKVLEVEDISDNLYLHYLYLDYNDELCNSKSTIVYKDTFGSEQSLLGNDISFAAGSYETKRFAIYCKND